MSSILRIGTCSILSGVKGRDGRKDSHLYHRQWKPHVGESSILVRVNDAFGSADFPCLRKAALEDSQSRFADSCSYAIVTTIFAFFCPPGIAPSAREKMRRWADISRGVHVRWHTHKRAREACGQTDDLWRSKCHGSSLFIFTCEMPRAFGLLFGRVGRRKKGGVVVVVALYVELPYRIALLVICSKGFLQSLCLTCERAKEWRHGNGCM